MAAVGHRSAHIGDGFDDNRKRGHREETVGYQIQGFLQQRYKELDLLQRHSGPRNHGNL